ncbi:recombinase-like helix-turn-helix domain-containing protein [Pseudomonas sp. BNK-6]|uniref:recombinase-like helix-turn-helix domain-containing protein n=1 Tax=unclassified Pseudomonas TaxID=196821 RepID=UPI003A8C846C
MTARAPYLEPHQARKRPSTPFEDLLGDAIERAFGKGISELPALLAHLDQAGPPCPLTHGKWTADAYKTLMARLGE